MEERDESGNVFLLDVSGVLAGSRGDGQDSCGCMEGFYFCGASMSFDEFWAEYPLRKAKIAARTAYDKARKVASHEQIMAGVRRYKPKQGFCKHPATWLNQGCWDDDEPVHHVRKLPDNVVIPTCDQCGEAPWKCQCPRRRVA